MTHQHLVDLLERAAARTEVGSPPVDAMLLGVRRRRRRHAVLAGAGLTVASVTTAILVPVLANPGHEQSPTRPVPSSTTQSPAPSPPRQSIDLEGTWIVTALVRESGAPAPATYRGIRLHIVFRDGTIRASDGCNELSGGYVVRGTQFRLKADAGSTLVGCHPVPPPLLARLSDVSSIDRDQGGTYLEDADGNVVIALHRD